MQGTGTQTDPYIPESWDEFVTAIGTSSAYVECPENAVWDMNDIAPNGLSSTIVISATKIDGNGTEIRNLTFVNRDSGFEMGRNCDIYNLKIINMYVMPDVTFAFCCNGKRLWFHDCALSGLYSGEILFRCTSGSSLRFIRSSLNLEINGKTLLCSIYDTAESPMFINCNIELNGKSTGTHETGAWNIDTNIMCLQSSLLSGDYPFDYLAFADSSSKRCYSSIIDMDVPTGTSFGINKNNGSSVSYLQSILINSDKIAEGVTVPDWLIPVTTAQLHDAAYLKSIGFPIGDE